MFPANDFYGEDEDDLEETSDFFLDDPEKKLAHAVRVAFLSDDQFPVYKEICHWIENKTSKLLTMGGFAGTGKSTLLAVIAQKYARKHVIAFCAYTGKAANVLRRKLSEAGVYTGNVSTLHKFMYYPVLGKDGEFLEWGRRSRDEIGATLIVVDEASMVDGDLFQDLASYDIPILAVGDHGQIAPFAGSDREVFNLMANPDLRLEKIHRQAEGNPILWLSKYVREHGDLPEVFPDDPHLTHVPMPSCQEVVRGLYKNRWDAEQRTVLCYTNNLRVALNNAVRETRFGEAARAGPRPDDIALCLRNEKRFFNGMRGVVVSVVPEKEHWYNMHFGVHDSSEQLVGLVNRYPFGCPNKFNSFSDFKAFGYTPKSWKDIGLLFDYGYCMTVHKSQGSSFDKVVVVCDRPHRISFEDYRRWLYTAVTRASKELVLVGG